MANYVVYVRARNGPKVENADFFYPDATTTTGDGHTSGSALDIIAGDTVSFKTLDQAGGTTSASCIISGLSIFTDNSNIALTSASPVTPASVTRTVAVAAATATADTITVSNETTQSDDFFFLRAAGGFSGEAPVISSVTNNDADSRSVIATVNLTSSGSGGSALEYAQTVGSFPPTTGWQTGNTFEHPRNTTRYYHASRDRFTTNASDTSSGIYVGYKDPATITVANDTIASGFATSYSATITGGIATHEAYTVSDTTGLASGNVIANSLDVLSPYTTGAQFVIPNGDLPSAGSNKTYYLYSERFGDSGGDDFFDEVGSFTITRSAADNTPEGFTALAGAVADADLSTQHYATFSGTTAGTTSPGTALALGTTIDNGTSISVSNGQWSTNGTTWNSGASTVNENDSVYFRGLSSASNGTPITHSLTIGTVTRSFTTTTFGDTFPDNYTNLAGNNIDADLSTVYYATFSTSQPGTTSPGTAFNVGTTISDGTSVSVNNGEYRINSGSFTSVAGTIDQNDSIYFRSNATASASGQTLIASLTIGSTSHNFQLRTGDVPGNTAGLGIGNETYGVVAFGPDGTTEVWGSNIRQTNIIIKESFSLANNSSSSFICADANDNSKVILSVGAPYPATGPASRAAQANLSVSATATGFTVSNTESTVSATLAVRVIASRIS